MRSLDQTIKVTNRTLIKIPFDPAHWQKVAAEKYPHGFRPCPRSHRPPKPFDQMDVRVSARGFANKNFTELASGASVHELTLNEGAAVRGRVLFNGQPVTNVTVGVVSVNRDMEHFTGNFDIGTDSDGRFLFVSLPPDVDYYIYGGMDSFKKLGAIPLKTIHAGKDCEVTDIGNLVVAPAHRLTGKVVLSDTVPRLGRATS